MAKLEKRYRQEAAMRVDELLRGWREARRTMTPSREDRDCGNVPHGRGR